jgi:hypothetical protein
MKSGGRDRAVDFAPLQQAKDETLKELLARKPGQKHYRRALKAYLEADSALQRAIIERLNSNSGE